MKKNNFLIAFTCLMSLLVSCSEFHRDSGKTYAPDMTYSRAVDYYNSTEKIEGAGGSYNKMPAKGSIAREQALPDHINEKDSALANAHMPSFDITEADVEKGRRLYMIHCGICHGEKMDGQGPLFTSNKFAAMPANLNDPKFVAYTPGLIYHAIVYGKNMMGSYASQLDTKQRWQVVAYIKSIQAKAGGKSLVGGSSEATASVKPVVDSTKKHN
jgi:mono/diheme cytochrome c family protein